MSAVPSVDQSGRLGPAPPVVGADAAQDLFERHAGAIFGFCLKRLGGREEAEDAVQTTFLNAFGALRRGAVPQHEAAWLYAIAENVCRSRHRSAGRRLEVVQDPTAIEEAAPAPERGDDLIGLEDALGRMAPRQRRALLLREWHGLSYREIARELRLTPAAVETLLFRARRSLARNLQLGSLVPWLKSLLGGSAALKTAAAATVVVASASLGGGAPAEPKRRVVAQTPAVAPSSPSLRTEGRWVGTSPADPGAATTPARRTQAAQGATTPTTRKTRSLPAGDSSAPEREAPAAGREDVTQSPPAPTAAAPAAPAAASPPPATLPASLPVPPAPPPPALPDLPPLSQLPAAPVLPPAPQLSASELPALPQVPLLPPPPPLPQLPKLP